MSAHRAIIDLSDALNHKSGATGSRVGIFITSFIGTPTASATGFATGCLAVDQSTGKWYTNTGTNASATWTVVGSQS